jgi:hypothetical protein
MIAPQHSARVFVALLASLGVGACNSSSSGGGTATPAPPALTSIQFVSRRDVPVGMVATSVAAGDVDGDGIDDLVVTRFQETKVTYLRSQANGNFAAGIDLPIGPLTPLNLTLADLDGDGKKDLIVADFANDTIYTYHNTGGAFAAPTSFATKKGPMSMVAADFDGDGTADIGVACTIEREVVVHLGQGALTYGPGIGFPLNGFPITLVTADFDNDGRPDAATCDIATSSLWVFHNEVDLVNPVPGFELTTWAVGATGTLVVGLAVGNLDATPDLELVTGSGDTNELLAWKFDGTNLTPTVQVTGPAPTAGVALADFDGDGKLDLTAAHFATAGASAWRGQGNLQFAAPATRATGLSPVFLAAADTSGDGRADAQFACSDSGEVSLFLGQAPAPGIDVVSGPPAVIGATQPLLLAAGDLNGDSRPDLLVADNTSNKVNILRNDGALAFTKMGQIVVAGAGSFQPILLDIDNDGDLDVAALHTAGATLLRNSGNFLFVEIESIPVAGGLLMGVAADLFQNGRMEFAATNVGADRISIFRNIAGNIDLLLNVATGASPTGIDVGDADGDGDLDIVNTNMASDMVTFTMRVGGTYVGNALNLAAEVAPVYVRLSDFNGDGFNDIAISHAVSTDVMQYETTGKLQYEVPALTPANGSPLGMAVADVDRNGFDDLIYTETQTGRAVVRLTQADGSFGVPVTNFASQYSVTTPLFVDLDGDSLEEILTGSSFSSLLQIHKNLSQ